MTETYAKCTYSRQLDACYNSTCKQLTDIVNKIAAVNNDWTLSDMAKRLETAKLKSRYASVKEAAYNKIWECCDEYKKRVDNLEATIGGKQIDKDDIFLLQSPMVMTQGEFNTLAEKHKGNYWMMRVLDDYCGKINKAASDEAVKEADKKEKDYVIPSAKLLSMPYEVYSFEEKRQRAERAANGFIDFISEAVFYDNTKEVASMGYSAYIAMDGYARLDTICCE